MTNLEYKEWLVVTSRQLQEVEITISEFAELVEAHTQRQVIEELELLAKKWHGFNVEFAVRERIAELKGKQ